MSKKQTKKPDYLKKIKKIDNSLAKLLRIKRQEMQITNIKNKEGNNTTVSKCIEGTLMEYNEQLYSNIFYILEMDKFLEWHKLPNLIQ